MKGIKILLVVIIAAIAIPQLLRLSRNEPALFPALNGPEAPTTLPDISPNLDIADYNNGNTDALALIVKDPSSSWFGLVSGLRRIGVPVRVVTSVEDASGHDVIMVYPALTGANATPAELQTLAAHVRRGGTLLAFSVLGGGMPALFGFTEASETPALTEMRFADDAFNRDFADSTAEAVISLRDTGSSATGLSGIRYLQPKHPPVATFNDGTAAITHNFYATDNGTGHAYALGLDLGHFILRANNGRFNNLADTYVNAYQPKVDTFLRFLRAVYLQGEDDSVLLSPAPDGKALSVLVTHDIDFTASIINTTEYASFEKQAGIHATYFIQTKYITDYNDRYFFTPERMGILKALVDDGMEIGSHSVAHSNEFQNMPIGTGEERYPQYRPFVQRFDKVNDASVLGELRVSKFLLEANSGVPVRSFRPGHLSLPPSLPQMLEATGYLYSSSITANQALTHLPFQAMADRGYDHVSGIFEFPVTIEDEAGSFEDRVDQAIEVAGHVAEYRGQVNLLVHTETVGEKLEFIRHFHDTFRNTAWFGALGEFGQWWAARNQVTWSITQSAPDSRRLQITAPESISGLTLELPPGWHYDSGLAGTRQENHLLILGMLSGNTTLNFSIN